MVFYRNRWYVEYLVAHFGLVLYLLFGVGLEAEEDASTPLCLFIFRCEVGKGTEGSNETAVFIVSIGTVDLITSVLGVEDVFAFDTTVEGEFRHVVCKSEAEVCLRESASSPLSVMIGIED